MYIRSSMWVLIIRMGVKVIRKIRQKVTTALTKKDKTTTETATREATATEATTTDTA